MFDLEVYEFKQKIISEINSSNLPLTVLHYVMKDLEKMVGEALTKQLEIEKSQQQQMPLMEAEPSLVDVDMN